MKKYIFIAALIITLVPTITYAESEQGDYGAVSQSQRDWSRGMRYTQEQINEMVEKARLEEEAAKREQQKNRKQKEPEQQQKSYWDF